jgi:hypothetical protein
VARYYASVTTKPLRGAPLPGAYEGWFYGVYVRV